MQLTLFHSTANTQQATALAPMIDTLRGDVAGLSADTEAERERAESAARDLKATKEKLTQMSEEVEQLTTAKNAEKAALFRAEQLPEKVRASLVKP